MALKTDEEEFELLSSPLSHEDEDEEPLILDDDNDNYDPDTHNASLSYPSKTGGFLGGLSSFLTRKTPGRRQRQRRRVSRGSETAYSRRRRLNLCYCPLRRAVARRVCLFSSALLAFMVLVLAASVNPSYTISLQPAHYHALQNRVLSSSQPGRGNPRNEKVFIAANIIDEELIRGAWGAAVVGLVELLGESNVFLSVYENDSGPGTKAALKELGGSVTCNSSIVSSHLPFDDIPHITLPSGQKRVKRIAYLAEVRNNALAPLTDPKSAASSTKFDKLLFLNDVVFSPLEAAHLLFSTNFNPERNTTSYRAACAVDFVNPVKFYDTFATRDTEGYSMGLPLFPWFAGHGSATSRADVWEGRDAVRVRSCWGGMVAFEGGWFQGWDDHPTDGGKTRGLRFRAEEELYWDASECCLIHADLQTLPSAATNSSSQNLADGDTGIYVNPFVRVAYDPWTFSWVEGGAVRRFERAMGGLQRVVNWAVRLPHWNPRRVGEKAGKAGFCGSRMLLVMKEGKLKEGERRWEKLEIPPER